MASILETPGTFTKQANIKAMLAVLAGAPLLGAAAGAYQEPGHPLKALVGGATGGATGGALGAGAGAAAMALLQAIAKKQIDPRVLSRAATLGALLGAGAGGMEGAQSTVGITGAPQEALLSAILDEMQQARRPPDYIPGRLM